MEDILPFEQDLATADVGGRLVQPGHREGDGGFAAARLTGKTEDLALSDIEAHRVDGAHVAIFGDVVDAKIAY